MNARRIQTIAVLAAGLSIFGLSSAIAQVSKEDIANFREFAAMKGAQASVKANMLTMQIAVESYAMETLGKYPKSILECKPFLDGGSAKLGAKGGDFPTNPISGVKNETPYEAGIHDQAQIDRMRGMPPQFTAGKPGQVGYSVFNNGKSYAIIGTDVNGNAIPGQDNKTLVLSNDKDTR